MNKDKCPECEQVGIHSMGCSGRVAFGRSRVCPRCKGTKREVTKHSTTWIDIEVDCTICKGRGFVERRQSGGK